jgi:HlyD family secretion protein
MEGCLFGKLFRLRQVFPMKKAVPLLALVLATGLTCGLGCHPATDVAGSDNAEPGPVSVDVLTATRTTMQRTTTQPATIHAYYEARTYAKAAGYLTELKADLGTIVKQGDILAVIGVPEMAKQREAKLAMIRRMESEERRAASQLAVANARAASYQANRDKAKADVGKADAGLAAARIELDRVTDLVKQQAVADRLQDESQKKHDAAVAEKTAAEAVVTAAEAELRLAGAQSDAARADVDVAQAMTDVARRELEELDELIKYAQIIAPFQGVVTQRNADPGDLVRNAQTGSRKDEKPLFVVSQFDKVRVRVNVPERDVPHTTVGDSVTITLQALPGSVFAGEISRVAGVLDEQTRTMMVEIDMDNSNGEIRPGMFGQASITLAPPGNSLTLPANAVRFDAEGNGYVYLVDTSNKVAIAEIQTGLDDGVQIEITGGLTSSDRVIGPLLHRLKAGQTVQVN